MTFANGLECVSETNLFAGKCQLGLKHTLRVTMLTMMHFNSIWKIFALLLGKQVRENIEGHLWPVCDDLQSSFHVEPQNCIRALRYVRVSLQTRSPWQQHIYT